MVERIARVWLAAALIGGALAGPARAGQGAPPPPAAADDLPSTVSPAIARFLREQGDRVPAVPPPAPPRPPATATETPRPSPRPTPEPWPDSRFGPNPTSITSVGIRPAPFEPTDHRLPINLAAALRLSDARPLVVAAAQAGVWVAEAELTRAKVLWVPDVFVGIDYTRHDGGGPDFNKGIMTAPSVNYFMAGAAASLYVNLTDAVYEPLVARRSLDAAHWNVQSSKNDALLRAADAYFRAHRHRGTYAGTLYTVKRGRELIQMIATQSDDLTTKVEAERARNMVADLEQRATLARQAWRVTSADLTQVLRLDPRAVLDLQEHDHAQITLVDPASSLDDLMAIALTNRPELAARVAEVGAAEARVRREKMRPVLPMVTVNGFQHPRFTLQAGIFGLGPNASLNQWKGRSDITVQLLWQLEGFGLGNLARIKRQRGLQSDAIIAWRREQDAVAADVTRALARVQSGAARIHQADRALRAGLVSFNGHMEGLGQTRRLGDFLAQSFRPQEAVFSLDLLQKAFDDYFSTVAEYNRAQFDLFHALGYPARELARLRPPGDLMPVDLDRPEYLPPVGNGPPPATR